MTDKKPMPLVRCYAAYTLLAGLVLSFFAGFWLHEGSNTSAYGDLQVYHRPAIYTLQHEPLVQALQHYQSATMPLFHLAIAFGPFSLDQPQYYLISTVISLAIAGLFFWLLIKRFGNTPDQLAVAALFTCVLLICPYYRGQAFWPSTDNTALWFVILALFFLDTETRLTLSSSWKAVACFLSAAIFSVAAFYTRQIYVWVVAYAFFALLLQRFVSRVWLLLFPLLLAPGAYLFWLWKGLTPPAFKTHHEGLTLEGIAFIFFSVFFCALPFFLAELFSKRLAIRLDKRLAVVTGLGIVFVLALVFMGHPPFVDEENIIKISGVFVKLVQFTGPWSVPLYFTIVGLGAVITVSVFQRVKWQSRLLIILWIGSTIVLRVSFQRYYDPLLLVVFLAAIDQDFVKRFYTFPAASITLALESLVWAASRFK